MYLLIRRKIEKHIGSLKKIRTQKFLLAHNCPSV